MSDYLSELEDIAEGDDIEIIIGYPPDHLDDVRVGRMMAHLRIVQRRQAELDAAWDAFMKPLLVHRNAVTDRNNLIIERIHTQLSQRLAADQADDPGLKRLDVPGGTLKFRQQQPEWLYDKDGSFVAWALDMGRDDLLHTKYEPDKNAVKAARVLDLPDGRPGDSVKLTETTTGEQVPGVTVTYRAPKLVIES